MIHSSPNRFSFRFRLAVALGALLLCALSSLTAQTGHWWDDYPMIIEAGDNVASVQGNNGTCGFGIGDPSCGMYFQKLTSSWYSPSQLHNVGCKYISYFETFGESTCIILQLGPTNPEGDSSAYRFWYSWSALDSNGGAFRWAGPQNYFDAEDFCGPYTRLHPLYGGGGRAMTYPDGSAATGYFNNDNTDFRKSRVLDAGSSKDILGGIKCQLNYQDDVAGNPLRSGGLLQVTVAGQSHLVGGATIGKDTACPMWIDLQRSTVLYSVGTKQIDGIWTDNFSPWDNFGYTAVKAAFGDWSVARFRTYLSANFTTAQLTAMGVSNVTTFDVRTALRAKLTALGGTDTNLDDGKWNDASWLNDSLWRAYKIFKRQVGTEALTNFYNASKDAAALMGVSDFAVMGNDVPVFNLGYCRGTLDVVSTELSPGWHMGTSSRGFMMPPVGRFAQTYKLGREHANSRLLNVWMYPDSAYKENPGAINTIYAEMLANQTLPMIHPGNAGTTQSATINGGLTRFVKNSRGTFAGRDSLTDVGIYYSTSSILAYMTPAGFLDMDNQPHTGAYNGWGTALGNLHYQYRPIPEWKLTADALSKLRVLVIPNAEVLDSADVTNIITPWVNAGGRLIVTGSSGARKGESGNFDTYTNLSLNGLTGVKKMSTAPDFKLSTVVSGTVYFIKANIGLAYFNASTAIDRANLISGFSDAMNLVLGTYKTLVYPVTTIPDTVGINVYETPAARRLFIDVNNYDVNLATDVVTPTPATTFTVTAPSWLAADSIGNIRVRVLSPTLPAPTVTVTKSGADRIQVDLGAVTNYASIVVSEATSLTWNGGGGNPSDSSGTWNATNTNWWNTAAAAWIDKSDALFGVGTGSNTPYTVTLGSGLNPTVGNLIFANQSYTLTSGTINLAATSEVQVDANRTATIASVLAGDSAMLRKTGSGTLILNSPSNTYKGGTWIDQGTLMTGVDGVLPASNDLNIANGATFDLNGTTQSINNLFLTGSGAASVVNNKSGTQATLILSGSYANQFSGILSDHSTGTGTLAVVKSGPGRLTLTGANTFTGPMTVSNGSLELASPSGPAMNDNLTIGYGVWLLLTADNQFGSNCTLNLNGEMVLQNTNQTISMLTGGGIVENDHLYSPLGVVSSGTATLTVNNNVADTFSGVIRDNAAGNGKVALIKTGAGTLVFTGNSTYTGATTISAGTLQLGDGTNGHDGSINSSASILNNATLAFNLFSNEVSYPAISGTGNVTKSGSGTLTMAANNIYSGTTTINSGTLTLMGASGWALNGSRAGNNVIVNSGATLTTYYGHQFGFTGTLANITVNSGGIFNGSGGNFMGQLALNGNASVIGTDYLGLTGGLVSYTGSSSETGTVAQNLYLADVPGNAVNVTVSVTGTNPAGDLMISGAISSPAGASVTKAGSGTLTLSGSNTYGGTTFISGGTLKARAASAIPIVNAGFESPAYGSGGWAYMTSGSDGVAGGWTSVNSSYAGIANNGSPWVMTAPQGTQVGYVQSSGMQGDLNQIITVGANGVYYLFFSAAGRPYYTSSNLSVRIDGTTITELAASLIVPGTFNTYSVPLNLTAGTHTLTFKATSVGGDNATAIDQVMISGVTASSLPSTTAVNLTSAGAILDLGDVPFVIGSLAGVASSSVLLNSPLTAGGDNTSTDFAGSISGTCSLTKTGSGTMTLSGSNAYTGSTTINAGKLKVMGSLNAGSTVTVNSTATLMGTGSVNGPVTVSSGGTIAPGASAGTLTVGSAVLGGIYACEINGAVADRITSTGSITINAGATLAFSTLSAPTLKSYILASYSGSLTGTFTNVTGTLTGYGVVYDASLKQIRLDQFAFNSWLSDHGLSGAAAAFNADPDRDGLANGLEIVLGGEPNPANAGSNSAALLPTVSGSSGNLVFTFKRKIVSESAVTLTFQWSTDLSFPSPANDIPVGASSSVTNGVTVNITQGVPDSQTDTIVITVPAAKAAGGKLFGRLKAVQAQ
jgi:autotransporter-associated beta strand protein